MRTWDVATGEVLTEMAHPAPAELRVRFLEAERWLVVWGSIGTTLRIFDIDTGDAVGVFEHRLDVSRARVTEDGERLVTVASRAGRPSILRVWDIASGEERFRTTLSTSFVRSLRSHGDQIYLHAGNTLQVRDDRTGELVLEVPLELGRRTTFLWDPPRALVLGDDDLHELDDIRTGERRFELTTTHRVRWFEITDAERLLLAVDMTRSSGDALSRGRIEVFDLTTGERQHVLDHRGPVDGVVQTNDPDRVITWTTASTAHRWNLVTGREEVRFQADDRISELRLAADDQLVMGRTGDHVTLWGPDGRVIEVLDHDREVLEVHPFDDARQLLTLSAETSGTYSTWRVWDVGDLSGTVRRPLLARGERRPVDEVMPMTDEGLLVARGGLTTGVLDLRTDQWVPSPPADETAPFAVLHDPPRVLSRGEGGLVAWRPDDGLVLWRLDPAGGPLRLARTTAGDRLLTVTSGPELAVIDTRTGEALREWVHPFAVRDEFLEAHTEIRLADDGRSALVGIGATPVVRVDLDTGETITRLGTTAAHPCRIAATSDLGVAVTWSTDDAEGTTELALWDGTTGEERGRRSDLPGRTAGARFTADGERLVTWTSDAVSLWEVPGLRAVARVDHDTVVRGVDLLDDAGLGLSWTGAETGRGSARVWRVADGGSVARFDHGARVGSVTRFAADRRLLTVSADDTARVWDLETGTEWMRVTHDADVMGGALFGDETRLLTWSRDDTARIWDVETGQELLKVFHPSLAGASLVAHETRLATWGGDGTVRLVAVDGVHSIATEDIPAFVDHLCRTRLLGQLYELPRSQVQVVDKRAAGILDRRAVDDVCAGAPPRPR
ncbi:MAG: hypothetical protein AAF602_10775 [Myxococcota bacterium]